MWLLAKMHEECLAGSLVGYEQESLQRKANFLAQWPWLMDLCASGVFRAKVCLPTTVFETVVVTYRQELPIVGLD
jgi:hypothetical protein